MLTSFAVSFKKVHQRTTKILPFDFNGNFSLFPNFIKMQQPACNYYKMLIHVNPHSTCLPFSAVSRNHVQITRNSYIFSENGYLTYKVYATEFHFALLGFRVFSKPK